MLAKCPEAHRLGQVLSWRLNAPKVFCMDCLDRHRASQCLLWPSVLQCFDNTVQWKRRMARGYLILKVRIDSYQEVFVCNLQPVPSEEDQCYLRTRQEILKCLQRSVQFLVGCVGHKLRGKSETLQPFLNIFGIVSRIFELIDGLIIAIADDQCHTFIHPASLVQAMLFG